MANISKQKREEFIAKTEALKQKEAIDDTDRLLLNDIINELNEKRYGLVYIDRTDSDCKNLKRIPKDSFYWYQKCIQENGDIK